MMLRAAASIVVAAGLTSAAIAPTPPVVGDKVALQAVPFQCSMKSPTAFSPSRFFV